MPTRVEDDATESAVKRAIYSDSKLEFVSQMNSAFGKPIRGKKNSKQMGLWKKECCPYWIFEHICLENAVECLTAILNGETNLYVDLNTPFVDGSYPLHYAALDLQYEMVDLLLRHGARADVRTTQFEFFCDNISPLDIALEVLCHHRCLVSWTEKQSIFRLIILLCLPDAMVAVDIIRMLTQNMEEVNEAFNHYAMEGNIIEMTALLMLARERVLAPSMSQFTDCARLAGSMSLKEFIATEMTILGLLEMKLMHGRINRNLLMMCKKKKTVMKNCLFVLEVFETVGDKIEKYIQSDRSHKPNQVVAEDVKTLMEEAGFVLKDKDVDLSDICGDAREREDIMLPTGVFAKGMSATQIRNFHSSNLLPAGSFYKEKKNTPDAINTRYDIRQKLSSKILPWGRTEDAKCRILESQMKLMRMEQMSGQKIFSVVSNIRKLLRRM